MQDGFSKFVVAHTIKKKEAETTAKQLMASWITKFGCPVTIQSDMGKEFENQLWHALCDQLQIQKTHTPPYNPQSNMVERFHQTLNMIKRVYLNRDDRSWHRYTDIAAFAYNTKVNETTGVTPFEAFIGRPARLPIDLILPTPERKYETQAEYIKDTMVHFEKKVQLDKGEDQGPIPTKC